MHIICLAIIPLFAALVAVVSIYICCAQVYKHLGPILEPLKNGNPDTDHFVENKIGELITKQLDEVVAMFKSQIPMASMFITHARETKLKEQARDELLKAVPDIKAAFCSNMPIVHFTDQLWRSVTYSLMGMGALIGLVLGLVELGLIMALC